MLDSDKLEILARLDEGLRSLELALDGVDEEEAAWRPASRDWSIRECVEHLALAEEYMLSRLEGARPAAGVLIDRGREAAILARGPDRTVRMESPELARPRDRYGSLREALASFYKVRARTADWVNGMDSDPRAWLTDHPIIQGPVNCREMLLIISVHPKRHAEQIRLVRDSLARSRRPGPADAPAGSAPGTP